jgi:hypothetical protein
LFSMSLVLPDKKLISGLISHFNRNNQLNRTMNVNQLFTKIALFDHYSIYDILQGVLIHLTGLSIVDINQLQRMCVVLINSQMNPLIKSHLVFLLRKRQLIIAKEICFLQVEESDNKTQFISLGEKLSDDFDYIPLEVKINWEFNLVYTIKTDRYGRTINIVPSEYCTKLEIPIIDELECIDNVMSDWNIILGRNQYDCSRCSYPVFQLLKENDPTKSKQVIDIQKKECSKYGINYVSNYDLIDQFINSGFKMDSVSLAMLVINNPIILRLVDTLYHYSPHDSGLCKIIKDTFMGLTYSAAGTGNLPMYQLLSRYAVNISYGLCNAYENGMVNIVKHILETSSVEFDTSWTLSCSPYRTFKMIDYCLSKNIFMPILAFAIRDNRIDVINYLNEKGMVITMDSLQEIIRLINNRDKLYIIHYRLDTLCYLFEHAKFDIPDKLKKILPNRSMNSYAFCKQIDILTWQMYRKN